MLECHDMRLRHRLFSVLLGIMFASVSCGSSSTTAPVDSSGPAQTFVTTSGDVTVTGAAKLSSRMAVKNAAVPLDTTSTLTVQYAAKSPDSAPKTAMTKETFTLVGAVNAPVVDGVTLGATGISIRGNFAFVSYNAPGTPAKGAVQVIQFDGGGVPSVISEVIFASRDVNAITMCGNDLYLALASPSFADAGTPVTYGAGATHGAALGKVTLDSQKKFASTSVTEVVLESYAANSISCSNSNVIASDGSTGGLSVFDRNLSSRAYHTEFADVRSAAFYSSSSYVALYGGTGGQTAAIAVVQNGSTVKTVTTHGATIAESKSVVTVVGGLALAALNDGGVKMVNLADGATVFSVAAPSVTGLPAAVTVSNSVSAYKNLMFIANGEAGVYMGKLDAKIESGPKNVTILGRLGLGLKHSANDIKYRGNMVFVAAGTGGFKILLVKNTDYDAEIQAEQQGDINNTDKN